MTRTAQRLHRTRLIQRLACPVLLALSAPAFSGQCTGLFDDPVQSHQVGLNLSEQVVLTSERSSLTTPAVSQPDDLLACGDQACTATETTSTALKLPAFITSDSDVRINLPAYSPETITIGMGPDYQSIHVGSETQARFSNHASHRMIQQLTLGDQSVIHMPAGDYWVESLVLEPGAQIRTLNGPVRIFVAHQLDLGVQSGLNNNQAADMLVVTWSDVRFRGLNSVNATIYSQNSIHSAADSVFSHRLSASELTLGPANRVRNAGVNPDLLLGLCSDFGPLPDADADGLPDGLDPDIDNDGFSNDEENLLGGNAMNATEQPNYGFSTVPDGNGGWADTNQCTDAYPNGLQSHAQDGYIWFSALSELRSGSSVVLETPEVYLPWLWPSTTCEGGACQASGVASSPLPQRTEWPESSGSTYLKLRPRSMNHLEADSASDVYRRIQQMPRGEVKLDAQGGEFVAGDVWIMPRATLVLTPGDYYLDTLTVSSLADVSVEGEGTVRLYLREDLIVLPGANINRSADNDQSQRLLIVVQQEAYLAYGTHVEAWVYSQQSAKISGHLTGGLSAANIRLNPLSSVTYDYPSLWQIDFSRHCDIDDDGQYDGFDPDRDGDGISNEYEKQLGYNPNDPTHTPADLDGDGLPDLLDEDRDGDGVANEDDVFPDDGTEWSDLDGDGIGNNTDIDRDGDGFSNEEEVSQGTDPDDRSDYPDVIPPQVTILPVDSLTTSPQIALTVMATDEYSGVQSVVVVNETTEIETALSRTETENEYSAPIDLTEGLNTLRVIAQDNWTNAGAAQVTINRDSTAPALEVLEPLSDSVSTLNLTVRLRVSDENSGVTDVFATDPTGLRTSFQTAGNAYVGQLTLTNGSNNVAFIARDRAGNQKRMFRTFIADALPPQFSDWSIPALTSESPVDVSVRITDEHSDVTAVSLRVNGAEAPVLFNSDVANASVILTEGLNQLAFSATDTLGNRATADVEINHDTTPPQLTLEAPNTLWHSSTDFTLSGTVSDDNAGIDAVRYDTQVLIVDNGQFSHNVTLLEGLNTLTVSASDLAGNEAEAQVEVGLDQSAPSLALEQSVDPYTKQSLLTLTGSVLDGQSGVAYLQLNRDDEQLDIEIAEDGRFATDLVLNEGENVGTLIATDNVGLTRELSFTTHYDAQPPLLTVEHNGQLLTSGETLAVRQSDQTISLSASDNETDVDSVSASLNGQPLNNVTAQSSLRLNLNDGTNTLSVKVIDLAGNETSLTQTFVLDQTPPDLQWLSDFTPTANVDYDVKWTAVDASGLTSHQLQVNGQTVEFNEAGSAYQASFVLQEGSNTLTVVATDAASNVATLEAQLTLDSTAPEIALSSVPSVVASEGLVISGTVTDASGVTLTLVSDVIPVNGQGQFSTTVILQEGLNELTWQALDALGNLTQQTVAVTADLSGPDIQVTIPAEVDQETLTVSGTVSDQYSDVASVSVINSTTGVPFNVVLNGNQFSADVLLVPESNSLIITAEDALGNTSDITVQTQLSVDGMQWQWLSHTYGEEVSEQSIVLEGLLETDLPANELSVTINGTTATVSPWNANAYSVRSSSLSLTPGDNTFEIKVTAAGTELVDSILIKRIDDQPTEPTVEPVLTVNSPESNRQVSGDYLTVSGEVKADSKPIVTINGQAVSVASSVPYYRFSETIAIPAASGQFDITIQAATQTGVQLLETRTVYVDNSAPLLSIDNSLQAYPTPTPVLENPYVLTGTVTDPNFSSLTINSNLVPVQPDGDDQFTFRIPLSLPNGTNTEIELVAKDSAGNTAAQSYVLRSDRSVELSWLLPLDNSQLLTYGDPFAIQVVAQSSEQNSTLRYQARLSNRTTEDDGSWVDMTFANGSAVTELTLDGSEGNFSVSVRVINSNGITVAALPDRQLTVSSPEQVPVDLLRVTPERGATDVPPKEAITLFFNQTIDPQQLTVTVHETAHGKTWMNLDEPGTEFFNAQGHQLTDVTREHEAVPFELQAVGKGKTIFVNLGREPAYNATLFITVDYNGNTLARYQYQTKALPTLVNLVVRDQFNREVPNLRVELDGESRTTNDKGLVQFGYQSEQPPRTNGDYDLAVNPGMLNAAYGETRLRIPLNGGELNDLGVIPVSFLNPEIGATELATGQNHNLLGDEVLLDLTNAQVTFPDGNTQGNVHVQFNTSGYNYPTHPLAEPSWLYSFQPLGVRLSGNPQLRLKLPAYQNSREYLPDNGTLMLLMAVNPSEQLIEPVGLAERQGDYAVALNPEAIQVLDHLGVVFLPESFQPILMEYQDGDINFTLLMARLAEKAREYAPEQREVSQ